MKLSSDRTRAKRIVDVVACASIFLLASGTSVAFGDAGGKNVIGKAGAVELTEADVHELVGSLPETARAQVLADPASLEQVVRAELVRRLVLGDARAKAFDKDPGTVTAIAKLHDDALARLWLEKSAQAPAGYPSNADVEAAYETARAKAQGASEYRLQQIFIGAADGLPPERIGTALRKAAEVQAKMAGGDFAALARTYSDQSESAAKGGDVGFLPEARLLPEVRAALANMKVGEVAGPIKTAQGLHFIKLTEKKPASVAALADVRESLVAALRQQRSSELQQQYLRELVAKSPPSINELALGTLKTVARK